MVSPDHVQQVVDAAVDYRVRRGWAVVAVQHRGKRALDEGWQQQRLTEDEIRRRFATGCNLGVLLGEASGGLVDVDLDVPEAIALAALFLPDTARFGHASKPESHYLYQVTE